MLKFTYRHYPTFTKRYIRFNPKQHGLPKSPAIEREIFRRHNDCCARSGVANTAFVDAGAISP
ncbi:hypothetical protein SAMN04487955_10311 [Halomonas korlensis]|uniref:Uncharacterized protein n=1 Tax=Halomonas korlensis TaxID=463301 RepID=A0A1I7GHH8_9GAMM|nr:hypothetical protein SAMN04487955_10311 [Halomonas korlensis]